MPPSEPSKYAPGQTALVAKIPEAEPLIGQWRSRFDSAAADGVPAHVTILYPFLDHERLNEHVIGRLGALIGAYPEINAQFLECGRFPGVLYLAPSPAKPFRALTQAVVEQWPEAEPYGGRFPEIVPHLTVAQEQDPIVLDQLETALAQGLPLATTIQEIHLLVTNGTHWRTAQAFPLQAVDSSWR